ncbi:MAG: hypothetical protein LBC12_00835 [Nitrososphaerota archaeon]|jgi:transposase-like protein|nr:hypothetical protein [Nitrososphaerota archaeon]
MTPKTLIKCPYCGGDKVSKNGHSKAGKQVYNCNNKTCTRGFATKLFKELQHFSV